MPQEDQPSCGGDAPQAERISQPRCLRCGCPVPSALHDLYWHSSVNGDVCGECWDILEGEENDEEEEGETIHSYDYKPLPNFLPELTPHTLFLGVELETDNNEYGRYNWDTASLLLINLDPEAHLFYLKDDGSLSYGFEVVSHPATLEYHQRTFPWQKIIDTVVAEGGKSHDTNTCGLHVHFNTNFFGIGTKEQNVQTLKLLYLVERYWTRLAIFSRRDEHSLKVWARRYHKQFSKWTPEKLQNEKKWAARNSAVNITNHSTIEIRLFKGTLHLPTLLATIEFVDYLARTAKGLTIEQLQRYTWTRFVHKIDHKRYPNLMSYLIERRLADVPNHSQAPRATPTD